MRVDLKCIYGDFHPRENPHDLDDEIAENLILQGLAIASETVKPKSDNEVIIKLEDDLKAKDEVITKLEDDLKAKDEVIIKLEDFVKVAIDSSKGTAPDGWAEYKG